MRRVIGFNYVLHDSDGELLDSSNGDPLHFMEGMRQIIPGLERVVSQMKLGEKRQVEVKAADAYGEVNPELEARVRRDQFPNGDELEIGDQFRVDSGDNAPVFTVTGIEGDTVIVDGNHPLAGRDLVFDIEITSMRDATPDELAMVPMDRDS